MALLFFKNLFLFVILLALSSGNKYQVFVMNDQGYCSGVLAQPSWVLLGSDCLTKRLGVSPWKLVKSASKPRQYRGVVRTSTCPEDNCHLAVLKVNRPFTIEPAKLWATSRNVPCDSGDYVSVTRDKHYNVIRSRFRVRPCPSYYQDSCICGQWKPRDDERKTVCDSLDRQDFSDGFLMCGDRVVGFLIWESCGIQGRILVFANVARFLDFVHLRKGRRGEEYAGVIGYVDGVSSDGRRLDGRHVYKFVAFGVVLVVLF